jgi:hypothetical protein
MNKPEKKHHHPKCYDYNEMVDYIEQKYGIQTRGYKSELDDEYRDFWHWIVDDGDIHNGCYFHLPEDWRDERYPWWVREIMELIVKEFFPGNLSEDEDAPYEDMVFYTWW